jgi:hypothetical protein
MRTRRWLRMILAWLLLTIAGTDDARADDPTDGAVDPKAEAKKLNAQIEKAIDWYEVFADSSAKTAIPPQSALRWRNVERGQDGEALLSIWAHNGRPEALASIYPYNGYLWHEFVSLSRNSKLVARDKNRVVWSPKAAGVDFKDVPEAPVPTETPAGRLRQMKSIADRFHATMTGWKEDNSDRQELRLLPRPVYRYDLKDAKETTPALRDGGLFAFVTGTDPEVVLMLEAVGPEDQVVWQFALARATGAGVEAKLDNQAVWTAGKANCADIILPMTCVGRPLAK